MPNLSVIIPIYNAENYIDESIKSVLEQTYKDFELILVDDGSTDGSSKIIQNYQEENPEQIKIITQANRGVSAARNKGINSSNCPYILFLDADDYIQEDMLELMIKEAEETEADLVLCNMRVVKDGSGDLINILFSGEMKNSIESAYDNKGLINTILPSACGKLYRKTLFTENHITFPLGLKIEDLGTIPRLLCHCKKIAKVNRVLYNYRYRKSSLARTYDYKILDVVKNLKTVKEYYIEQKVDKIFHQQLEYLYIDHLLFRSISRISHIKDPGMRDELIESVIQAINDEYPNWMLNKKIKKLPLKKRTYLKLIEKGQVSKLATMKTHLKKRR